MQTLLAAALITTTASAASPRQDAVLYETVDDWRAGRPAHQPLSLPIQALPNAERIRAQEDTLEFVAMDVDRPVARAIGNVAVIESGGQVFYNEDAPRPFRSRAFGPMHIVGDQALYAAEECTWLSTGSGGSLLCWNEVRALDLDTLEHRTITRRRLRRTLRAHPDLLQAWRNEGRKDASARWRTSEALLRRTEADIDG